MNAPSNHEESLFERALGMDSSEARESFLREACGQDRALRERLLGLLRAHDRAGKFLEHREPPAATDRSAEILPAHAASAANETAPAPDADAPSAPGRRDACPTGDAEAGDRIGRYKLLEKIGEGGMGTVWMAEQEEPVRRRVALKIIKLGMDTREVIARFEAERQALALMGHPNIARVFDGGVVGGAESPMVNRQSPIPQGRPYFVMELVRGLSITKYCEELKLSTRDRLELFGQVCRAVQHAHQKGVIHRDLKPSNILVTEQDGRPVPKVIDFGIAKATEGRLTDKTLFTGFAQLIGTPAYMSPEQAGLGSLDIDTRSDTYSLGVVLYELLTGRPPFDTKELMKSGLDAVLRTIREEDPPKPSTVVERDLKLRVESGSHGARHASLNSQLKLLSTALRGDLDWIVMKCLEKDRARRYETPNALALDLDHYLHDELVQARPPTTGYRLRKFVSKHRGPVAAAAGFVVLLVAATAVSVGLALWANRERSKAVVARNAASVERTRAIHAEGVATDKARQAETVSTFLVKSFRRPDPSRDGRDLRVVEILDQAVQNLEEFADSPKTQGDLLDSLGRTYGGLGLNERAVELHETALKLRQSVLGPNHRDTLATMGCLALAYLDSGRLSNAHSLAEQTLELSRAESGADDPDTIASLNNLALTCQASERFREAIPLYEQARDLCLVKLGTNDPRTTLSMHNLAEAYRRAGDLARALPLLEAALQHQIALRGTNHTDVFFTMNNLGLAYLEAGRLDEALPLLRRTLELRQAKLGPSHRITLGSMHNLAWAQRQAGRLDEAAALFEKTLDLQKQHVGADHPDTLTTMNNLALAYQDAGRLDEALPLFHQTLELRKAKLPPDHPLTLASMNNLAWAHKQAGRFVEATALFEETLDLQRKHVGADHPKTLSLMNSLALTYMQATQFDNAKSLLRNLVEQLRKSLPADSPALGDALSLFGECLLRQGKPADAESPLRESLGILQKHYPDRSPVFVAQSLLGWALLELKKLDEAENFLLTAHEGLTKRESRRSARTHTQLLKDTAERLVQLYEALGKPELAARWRAKVIVPGRPSDNVQP